MPGLTDGGIVLATVKAGALRGPAANLDPGGCGRKEHGAFGADRSGVDEPTLARALEPHFSGSGAVASGLEWQVARKMA